MTAKTPLRPRRAPQRTCVGCGTTTAKRGLIRIVRTPAGQVLPDPTGKMSGRGAYLCASQECWDQALKKGRLERSLKTQLTPEDLASAHAFAAGLDPAMAGAP